MQSFTRRPGVFGAALLLGGLLLAAPEVSWAKERCTTKPAVCARMKAVRAQQGPATSSTLPLAAPSTTVQAQTVALNTDANCSLKPGVCARLRNQAAARGYQPAPVLAYAATSERCTTKPSVCARLKSGPGQRPVTMASEPGPSALE